MPASINNRIGDEVFVTLKGEVIPPSERVQPMQRPGIVGTGFLFIGAAGKQFTLRSFVDCLDIAEAESTFAGHLELIRGQPVNLVVNGYDYGVEAAEPWLVKVLDVRKVTQKAVATVVGGRHVRDGESGVILECEWTLIGVAT